MAWTLTDDIGDYHDATAGLLSSEPVRYNVLATVLDALVKLGPNAFGSDSPVLGWWSHGDGVQACVLQTPPHPMLITALPAGSATELATALAERNGPRSDARLPGINGSEPDALALAAAWSALTGHGFLVDQRLRLHRLGELILPDPAPSGVARLAGIKDTAIARSFYAAFAAEVNQLGASDQMVAKRLQNGELMLWEAAGGPVSIAGVSGVTRGVARVGPVYTPPGERGKGYGGAVTAAISRLAIDRGAQSVILFTDLANPVSNELYRRLGYLAVEDRVVIRLEYQTRP